MQKIVVEGRLPGQNELMGYRWQASYSKKREAKEQVIWAIKAAKIKPVKCFCEITIACFEKNKKRDEDNVLGGAAKIVFDALKASGIIIDDSPKHVHYIPRPVQVDGKKPRVEITIEERAEDG